MPDTRRIWLAALGAGLAGALLGAGAVWATQQATLAAMSARVIRADANTQAALQRADELQTRLDDITSSAASEPASAPPTAPSPAPKPASKTVKQFTFVKNIIEFDGTPVIVADYAEMLTGSKAAKAAAARGDESPPPNDYYIVNDNTKRRDLEVKAGISVTVTTNADGTADPTGHAISFEDWAASFSAPSPENEPLRTAPYWITIQDGVVTKIAQQYLP